MTTISTTSTLVVHMSDPFPNLAGQPRGRARFRAKPLRVRVSIALAALAATMTSGVPAALAQTVYGQIYVTNNTPNTLTGITGSVSGQWSTAGQPMNNPYYDGWTVGGSPPGIVGPGQTIVLESQSNGGVATGTGGSVTIPNVGTINWTVPWGYFHGLPNTYCDSSINAASGFTIATISGGLASAVGANTCPFYFTLDSPAPQQSLSSGLISGQALAQGTTFTSVTTGTKSLQLKQNGNLVLLDTSTSPATQLWATNTSTADVAYMSPAGNFEVFDISGDIIWSTDTWNPGSSLIVGFFGIPNWFLDDSTNNLVPWISPGGSFPATGVFWNTSFDATSPPLSDWNYGYYKGTCQTGQPVTGVSRYTNAVQSHEVQCGGARYQTTQSQCYLKTIGYGNRGTTDGGWDWDQGSYKVECASNEFVQGVSQSTSGDLNGVLCCPATAFEATSLFSTPSDVPLQHLYCDAQVFYNNNSNAYQSPDWDNGYYKGECPSGQYVAGISTPAYSSIGTFGAAHAILCCAPGAY